MIKLIVAAVILIVIMLVFVFILFKNIIKRMDENAKKYFVNKMKDYDYILEEKQNKLEEIKTEIQEIKVQNKNILKDDEYELKDDDTNKIKNKKEAEIYEDINQNNSTQQAKEVKYNLNVPEYREMQFFNNYKQVRRIFTVNNEKIIKDFIAEHKNLKEEQEYKKLQNIREKFNKDAIYECLTLNSDQQTEVLKEVLTPDEQKIVQFDTLIQNAKFSVKDLVKFIDDRMDQIDPTIYIYTNNIENKYDLLDSNIIVEQYNNMSEGIIIKYRSKIYDYSI